MHTKGKWENNDGDIVVKVQDNWPLIAIVQYVKTMAETRANARLIAAAPDLLAACKNAILLIIGERIKNDNLKPDSIIEEHLDVLIRKSENELEEAIKKAEG